MNEFLSFLGVIALWIGVSVLVWWAHQRRTGSRQQRRIELARAAAGKVAEAQAVLDFIRRDLPKGVPLEDLAQQTHALLKRIQQRGDFFDAVNALRPQLKRVFGEECEPLAEILHIRRDLWAASEIVLIEDFRTLGPDFADEGAYATLREEAVNVLLPAASKISAPHDLIDLRLSLARDEALQFVADVEQAVNLAREHERLPTASEVISYPVAAARALPGQLRSARDQTASFYGQVRAVAVTIRQSESVVKGLAELRRARAELPQRVVAGLGRTSAAAKQSATSLKGHYDFLAAAYDFQTRYEELIRKTPVLTERGKQFIARLELAEKSERLKLTSATLRDALKRGAVRGLAYLIAGLQHAQAALEKQLASASAASTPGKTDAAAAKSAGRAGVVVKASGVAGAKEAGAQPVVGNTVQREDAAVAPTGRAGSPWRAAAKVAPEPAVTPVLKPSAPMAQEPREPALGQMHRLKGARPKTPGLTRAANPLPPLKLKGLAPLDAAAAGAPDAAKAVPPGAASKGADEGPRQSSKSPASPASPASRPLKLQPAAPASAPATPSPAAPLTLSAMPVPPSANGEEPKPATATVAAAAVETKVNTADPAAVATEKTVKRGWFGRRRQPKAAVAPVASSANGAESKLAATPKAAVETKADTVKPAAVMAEKPAKRGWFGGRKQPKAADAPVTPMANGPEPKLAETQKAAVETKADTVKPAGVMAEKPAKRGWFGGRKQPKAAAAPVAPPTVAEPKLAEPRKAAVEMKADTAKPAAVLAEKPAKRGWFGGRKQHKPAAVPVAPSAGVAEPKLAEPRKVAVEAKADTAKSAAVVAEKPAKRGWFGRRKQPKAAAAPVAPPANGAEPKLAETRKTAVESKADTVKPAAVLAEKPAKRGWFGGRKQPKAAAVPVAPPANGVEPKLAETQKAAVETKTDTAKPAAAVAEKPAKRGWFGRRKPAKVVAAPVAPPSPPAAKDGSPAQQPAGASSDAPRKPARRGWFGKRRQPKPPTTAIPAVSAPQTSIATPAPEAAVQIEAPAVPAPAPAAIAALEPAKPEPAPEPSQARAVKPRASLSAKLNAVEGIDPTADEPDDLELTAQDTEPDDSGPLTQTILKSRDRQDEKPGGSTSRAFPWLRR
jgi:hypothetical protein